MDWNDRCRDSIKKERSEIEARYNIRIGQTDIKCARCGRPCTPGQHTCQDIRLKRLNEAKGDVPLSQAEFTI